MKRIANLFLLCILLIPFRTIACGNEYEVMTKPDLSAVELEGGDGTFPSSFTHGFDTTYLLEQKAILSERIQKDSSYQDLSDLALIELKIGDKYKAVKMLEKLYNQHPDEYNIVANLGTGYELTGNNELAYRFIKRALEIDPKSHQGSEWIHLNILEQKLKDSPDYTAVLNLEIGKNLSEFYKGLSESQIQVFNKTKWELAYQLRERTGFVAPEDVIVAQLLLDLGDLVAITESMERAHPIYQLAQQYGSNTPLLDVRLAEINKVPYHNPLEKYWYWGVLAFGLAAVIYYLIMTRFRKVNLNKQNKADKTLA